MCLLGDMVSGIQFSLGKLGFSHCPSALLKMKVRRIIPLENCSWSTSGAYKFSVYCSLAPGIDVFIFTHFSEISLFLQRLFFVLLLTEISYLTDGNTGMKMQAGFWICMWNNYCKVVSEN